MRSQGETGDTEEKSVLTVRRERRERGETGSDIPDDRDEDQAAVQKSCLFTLLFPATHGWIL